MRNRLLLIDAVAVLVAMVATGFVSLFFVLTVLVLLAAPTLLLYVVVPDTRRGLVIRFVFTAITVALVIFIMVSEVNFSETWENLNINRGSISNVADDILRAIHLKGDESDDAGGETAPAIDVPSEAPVVEPTASPTLAPPPTLMPTQIPATPEPTSRWH